MRAKKLYSPSIHQFTVFNVVILLFIISGCTSSTSESALESTPTLERELIEFEQEQAEYLLSLPLKCLQQEYPNKLGQVLGDSSDLLSPRELHPAFYGCFDWHSAVHGHWMSVYLLKKFPDLKNRELLRSILIHNMSSKNILAEVNYFQGAHSKSYERTYGWAWLLKLAEELHTWPDPLARKLEKNLQPLTDLIVSRYKDFLPRLNHPIRVGEHPNTAFGMSFAFDYATTVKDNNLLNLLSQRAQYYFAEDRRCPITWEPGGFDFLSPCLEEAGLMNRILSPMEYKKWVSAFLPQLKDLGFKMKVAKVSDRSDGKLVHLDGLNFSRAWCLSRLANDHPHLRRIALTHIQASLPQIVDGGYEGEHWLASFAVYALKSMEEE